MNIKEIFERERLYTASTIDSYEHNKSIDRIEAAVTKRIEELEAQVAKVVTLDARTVASKTCDCGKLLCRFDNYCYNCGAKLNWENK